MNIQRINPLGYEAKTDKGNTYRKTNAMTTTFVVSGIISEAAPYIIKTKNPLAKTLIETLSIGKSMPEIVETFAKMKLPSAAKAGIAILGTAIAIGTQYAFGRWIDNNTNKKRAEKADQKVQAQQIETNV